MFLTGSIAAQGLGALSGLLFAWWMSVGDYGAYTIVMTLMGAITLLTKGGTHLGYTAILGRTWPDMHRAAEAIAAALRVRRLISIVIMPPLLLITWLLLHRAGVEGVRIAAVLALLAALWWADMQTRLIDQVLFFAKQTSRLQLLDTALAALRLAGTVMLHVAGMLGLIGSVAITVMVALLRVRPILYWVRALLPPAPPPPPTPADLTEIGASVRRQLPVEVYYVFQSQLVLILLSLFGSMEQIAGLGALSRINQLLVPVEALTIAFLVPAFTRASTERALHIHVPLVLLTMVPGTVLTLLAWVHPQALLWLVGANYAHLTQEIFISCLVNTLLRGTSSAWSLLAHRGWVRFSWVQIPVGLGFCALAPLVLDLGTLTGAILLQLAFAAGLIAATTMDFRTAARRQD